MPRSRASLRRYHNLLVYFLQAHYLVDLWPNVAGLKGNAQNYFRIKVLLYEFIRLCIRRRLLSGRSLAIRNHSTSVQAILEYDDLRMLRALGNIVFPLGEALARLEVTGCCDDRGAAGILLSTKFVDQFDLAIVMHDAETLVRPVAWRTVGQDMTVMEARIG